MYFFSFLLDSCLTFLFLTKYDKEQSDIKTRMHETLRKICVDYYVSIINKNNGLLH